MRLEVHLSILSHVNQHQILSHSVTIKFNSSFKYMSQLDFLTRGFQHIYSNNGTYLLNNGFKWQYQRKTCWNALRVRVSSINNKQNSPLVWFHATTINIDPITLCKVTGCFGLGEWSDESLHFLSCCSQ